ncbi:MAG: response regulator [Rhodobacteraceae bacterium CG17_big_fil_post_rev_8_21_14_2_50_65_11]|nr:MAG: response regulator [Rhodobacteraceae bacterium CG17_big_fil_post_rev_8_21_14_2_50_65_11]
MDTETRRPGDDIAFFQPVPTPDRPLAGLTVLVVEDSRFASEALRLMCLRSGARIRRADCLASAHRHLNTYRPSVAIVDLGLPDGSGLTLIEEVHKTRLRVPVLLATSGAERAAAEQAALAAGADGFLPKPVQSLGAFQAAILAHVPADMQPDGPRPVETGTIHPDQLALREDLSHALDLLAQDPLPTGYLRRFLLGLARTADDIGLLETARALPARPAHADRVNLRALLTDRVAGMATV